MALQITITTDTGIEVVDAYARIVGGDFVKESIRVNVSVYKDKDARDSGLRPIANFTLSFPLNNGATFDSLYAAIKTDSNFVGAIDV